MNSILFVRPCHDDVLGYLHYYSKFLVKEAKDRGFDVSNKEKSSANKQTVTKVINKFNPKFIMFNGHGLPDGICGHDNEVIIKKNDNCDLLKKRVVYALSCSSALELGQHIADKKTTFIGYVDEFALGMDTNSQASIAKDKRARLFMEPSNILVKSLLKGNSPKDAIKKARKVMRRNINILKTDSAPDAKDYLPYLVNNYYVLDVFGNDAVKLKS